METTILRMLPVCECGQLIPDFNIEVSLEKIESRYDYPNFIFHPDRCPSCGKYINGLQVDSKYAELFCRGDT